MSKSAKALITAMTDALDGKGMEAATEKEQKTERIQAQKNLIKINSLKEDMRQEANGLNVLTSIKVTKAATPQIDYVFKEHFRGNCTILPSGKVSANMYGRSFEDVTKEDIKRNLESSKARAVMVTPPNLIERLAMLGEKVKDNRGLDTLAMVTVLPAASMTLAKKIIASQLKSKAKYGSKDMLFAERMYELEERKIAKKAIKDLPKLLDSMEKTGTVKTEKLPKMDRRFEDYLRGINTILPSGKVEGPMIHHTDNMVSKEDVQKQVELAAKGINMVASPNALERVVLASEKIRMRPNSAGMLKTAAVATAAAAARTILKIKNKTDKERTQTYHERMVDLDKRKVFEAGKVALPKLLGQMKNGR